MTAQRRWADREQDVAILLAVEIARRRPAGPVIDRACRGVRAIPPNPAAHSSGSNWSGGIITRGERLRRERPQPDGSTRPAARRWRGGVPARAGARGR